jgi:hypothetical protein
LTIVELFLCDQALSLLGLDYDLAKIYENAMWEDDDNEFLRPAFSRVAFR